MGLFYFRTRDCIESQEEKMFVSIPVDGAFLFQALDSFSALAKQLFVSIPVDGAFLFQELSPKTTNADMA